MEVFSCEILLYDNDGSSNASRCVTLFQNRIDAIDRICFSAGPHNLINKIKYLVKGKIINNKKT